LDERRLEAVPIAAATMYGSIMVVALCCRSTTAEGKAGRNNERARDAADVARRMATNERPAKRSTRSKKEDR